MDVGAADKAAIQLVKLRLTSAEVKSSRIPPRRIKRKPTPQANVVHPPLEELAN